MWKPGAKKPGRTPKKNTPKKKGGSDGGDSASLHMAQMPLTPPSGGATKSSTPKRLSGATMNMRFMKRKEADDRRQNVSVNSASKSPHPSTPAHGETSTPASQQRQDDSMEVETTTTTTTAAAAATPNASSRPLHPLIDPKAGESSTINSYETATPVDMYGMQASLIGRRSFGGFNPAMEDAWKGGKASIENRSSDNTKSKQKISDEELLQRYQDIVKKRSASSRSVGNLADKGKRKKKRKSS